MKQFRFGFFSTVKSLMLSTPVVLLASAVLIGCSKDDDDPYVTPPPPQGPVSTVVSGTGDLQAQLTQFRSILGDSLNTAPGKTSGRREVNWDGVPEQFTDNNPFPFDFFNSTDPAVGNGRKRGLVYQNTGTSFRVSTNDFSDVDASYGDQFAPFSGGKTFAYMGDNVSEISFRVAGTNTNAFVKGFGLVFSDIDDANSTTVEFFNGTKSLGVFKAPKQGTATSFSFLGVFFPEEKITKVRIVAGNGVLGTGVKDVSDGGTKDLVIMDDFFYSEPVSLN